MHTLNGDFFYDIGSPAERFRPRRKTVVDRLLSRLAIGQIMGEQFLYEVHGPFVAVEPVQTRHRFSGRSGGPLMAWLRGLATRIRLHRAACDVSELDDRMLTDIGLTRSEIDAAVFGAPVRTRGD